jgi:hydrogenase maturation protease
MVVLSEVKQPPGAPKALVIGFGNTLRGDDGLGPFIVEGLEDLRGSLNLDFRSIRLPQLDLILTPEIGSADVVIFVDARDDNDDDLVKVELIEPEEAVGGRGYTTHLTAIPGLLGLARDWFGKAPICYAVMPKGIDFSFGETFSPLAQGASALAREKIIDLLQSVVS